MDDPSWGRTLYRYRSEPALEAVRDYSALAKEYGVSLTDLSLRWCKQRRLVTTTLVAQVGKSLQEQVPPRMYHGKVAFPFSSPICAFWIRVNVTTEMILVRLLVGLGMRKCRQQWPSCRKTFVLSNKNHCQTTSCGKSTACICVIVFRCSAARQSGASGKVKGRSGKEFHDAML